MAAFLLQNMTLKQLNLLLSNVLHCILIYYLLMAYPVIMNNQVASTGYDPLTPMPVLRAFAVLEEFKSAAMNMLILLGGTLCNILMGIGCLALVFGALIFGALKLRPAIRAKFIKWSTVGLDTLCGGSGMDLNEQSAEKRNGPDTEDKAPAKSESSMESFGNFDAKTSSDDKPETSPDNELEQSLVNTAVQKPISPPSMGKPLTWATPKSTGTLWDGPDFDHLCTAVLFKDELKDEAVLAYDEKSRSQPSKPKAKRSPTKDLKVKRVTFEDGPLQQLGSVALNCQQEFKSKDKFEPIKSREQNTAGLMKIKCWKCKRIGHQRTHCHLYQKPKSNETFEQFYERMRRQ
mmetsp:Transcript_12616/g.16273  ORF Transcript_12616/g.16273 Transcript_12616/m.16273 type:complete len:347 (-) Transcript_12616:1630-2670(-)